MTANNCIVVSLHDVAPGSAGQSMRWLSIVERYGLRASLLVVPGPWRNGSLATDASFASWLRAARDRGHELSLHGWEHRATAHRSDSRHATVRHSLVGNVLARGCQEFWQLGTREADRRIGAGLEVLSNAGIEVDGFTPPGWLASPETVEVLRARGFLYTTTQWSVINLRDGRSLPISALSQRPGSVLTRAAAATNERIALRRLTRGLPLRLALHPDDLADRQLVSSVHRILDSAVINQTQSTTYAELVNARSPINELAEAVS